MLPAMLGVNRDLASAGRAKPFLPTGFQKFGDGGFPLAFASHSRLLSSLLFEDGRGNPHRRRSIGVATSECRGLTMAIVTKKLEIAASDAETVMIIQKSSEKRSVRR